MWNSSSTKIEGIRKTGSTSNPKRSKVPKGSIPQIGRPRAPPRTTKQSSQVATAPRPTCDIYLCRPREASMARDPHSNVERVIPASRTQIGMIATRASRHSGCFGGVNYVRVDWPRLFVLYHNKVISHSNFLSLIAAHR